MYMFYYTACTSHLEGLPLQGHAHTGMMFGVIYVVYFIDSKLARGEGRLVC